MRLKDIPPGTQFKTRLTHRYGVVSAHVGDAVEVVLSGRPKVLHPEVLVDIVQ